MLRIRVEQSNFTLEIDEKLLDKVLSWVTEMYGGNIRIEYL